MFPDSDGNRRVVGYRPMLCDSNAKNHVWAGERFKQDSPFRLLPPEICPLDSAREVSKQFSGSSSWLPIFQRSSLPWCRERLFARPPIFYFSSTGSRESSWEAHRILPLPHGSMSGIGNGELVWYFGLESPSTARNENLEPAVTVPREREWAGRREFGGPRRMVLSAPGRF